MALTQISTAGVKDDAVTSGKIPANAVGSSELADNAVDTAAIADQAVTLAKLPHGTSSNDGKFLRANNGADPSFETVNTTTNLGINFYSDSATVTSSTGTNVSITEASSSQAGLMSTTHHDKLDGIASGATYSNINGNVDGRVLTATGTSGVSQGESGLTFDGAHLELGSGKGIRTNFIRPAQGSNTNTGSASQQYWKIGEIGLNGSEAAVITLMGANGYSSGTAAAGETTIVLRGSNGNTLLGFWYSDAAGDNGTYSDVRWKHISGVNYELWVSAGPYNNIAPIVKTTGTFDNTNAAGTGSNNAPSGSTALASSHRKRVGSIDTIEYQSTGTIFKRNIVMANTYGIDFSATANASSSESTTTMSNELFDDYEVGTWQPTWSAVHGTIGHLSRHGDYIKIGRTVHCMFAISANGSSLSNASELKIVGLPFSATIPNANGTRGGGGVLFAGYHMNSDVTKCVANGTTLYLLLSDNSRLQTNSSGIGYGYNAAQLSGMFSYITAS